MMIVIRLEDLSAKDVDRYWLKVDRADGGKCWEWLASKFSDGYGQFYLNGTTVLAHRLAWVIANQADIPSGMCVLHTCDNKGCCNPTHLFLGTQADNMRDKVEKGRSVYGEDNGQSKLTEAQAILIKATYPAASQYLLSKVFGVSGAQISRIVNNKNWSHLRLQTQETP